MPHPYRSGDSPSTHLLPRCFPPAIRSPILAAPRIIPSQLILTCHTLPCVPGRISREELTRRGVVRRRRKGCFPRDVHTFCTRFPGDEKRHRASNELRVRTDTQELPPLSF